MGEDGLSESSQGGGEDLERRIEELRRTNEELGRELVAGGESRQPRTPVAAARALAKLTYERDSEQEEREAGDARLTAANAELERLRDENAQLRYEVGRLRSGTLGLLRRLRARLLRR